MPDAIEITLITLYGGIKKSFRISNWNKTTRNSIPVQLTLTGNCLCWSVLHVEIPKTRHSQQLLTQRRLQCLQRLETSVRTRRVCWCVRCFCSFELWKKCGERRIWTPLGVSLFFSIPFSIWIPFYGLERDELYQSKDCQSIIWSWLDIDPDEVTIHRSRKRYNPMRISSRLVILSSPPDRWIAVDGACGHQHVDDSISRFLL